MAIYNPDGTLYVPGRGINVVDDDGKSTRPEELINLYDKHIIRRSGYPILYYELFAEGDIDPLYGQIIDKIRSTVGIRIFSIFEPERPPQELTVWGIDSPELRVYRVNRDEWFELARKDPVPGSIIFCKWDRSWWSLLQANQVEFHGWGKYGIELVASKRTSSIIDTSQDRTKEIGEPNDYGHGLPQLKPGADERPDYPVL